MTMTYLQARILLRELIDITVNPGNHDQTVWVQADKNPDQSPATECGTVGCLAGNTVMHAPDHKLIWEQVEVYNQATDKYEMKWRANEAKTPEGTKTVMDAFQDLVGLSRSETRNITKMYNSLGDLWSRAVAYSGGEITVYHVVAAFKRREDKVKRDLRAALYQTVDKI